MGLSNRICNLNRSPEPIISAAVARVLFHSHVGAWSLLLVIQALFGYGWGQVGRGLPTVADVAVCLKRASTGLSGVGTCGCACPRRKKGWPLMLTILVCCGKDWGHVGQGLAADSHDASLVCVGACGWLRGKRAGQ